MRNDMNYNRPVGDDEVVIVETAEVEVIQQDIDQTRQSIGETLSEIKDKLNPGEMIDHAKEAASEMVHNATEHVKDSAKGAVNSAVQPIKDMGSTVKDRVKSNPLPLLLIGAAAWYFYGRSDQPTVEQNEYRGFDEEPGMMDKAKEKVSSAYDSTVEAVSSGFDTAKTKAGDMGSGIVDTVKSNPIPFLMIGAGAAMLLANNKSSSTTESFNYYGNQYPEGSEERSMVGNAKDKVGEVAGSAKDATVRTWEKGRSTVSRTYETSPLVYGAIAVGAGAALAVMLPRTQFENDLMGDMSDRVKERATDKVKELGHEAKEVARQTVDTAKETAKEEAHNRGMLK